MRVVAASLVLFAATRAAATPACVLTSRPFLEGRVSGSGAKLMRTVDARAGERVEVFLAAAGRLDGRAVIFGDADGRTPWSRCGAVDVAWRRIEPRMQHVDTPAPNKSIAIYSNAVVFGPNHGKWIGFDRLEYFETAMAHKGTRIIVDGAAPTTPATPREGAWAQLGTMRLHATVTLDGKSSSTPGLDDAPDGQIADRVFRYTYRQGDDFIGWLTSYFNVPYLFGSAGKGARSQAERYVGADCADVLVAALRRTGRRDLEYSSVEGLVGSLERVAGPMRLTDADRLHVGRDVRPGDLLALDYVGVAELPRAYDHIVAFVEDRGADGRPDGVLGPEDLVADSGDALGLKFAPLAEQGDVRVTVLRLRAKRAAR
jgi:hypothetical protein